jgi:hypothetical protein
MLSADDELTWPRLLAATEDISDRLRQVGGLGPLLSHVSSEDVTLVQELLKLVADLSLNGSFFFPVPALYGSHKRNAHKRTRACVMEL